MSDNSAGMGGTGSGNAGSGGSGTENGNVKAKVDETAKAVAGRNANAEAKADGNANASDQGSGNAGANGAGIPQNEPIARKLEDNAQRMMQVFQNCDDFQQVSWTLGGTQTVAGAAFYFETLTYSDNRPDVVRELVNDLLRHEFLDGQNTSSEKLAAYLDTHGVPATNSTIVTTFGDVVQEVLSGKVVILLDGWDKAVVIDAGNPETRPISEPMNEAVIAGPHVGTVEDLKKNVGLLRSRLQSAAFKLKLIQTGGQTKTSVVYGYLDGVIDERLLQEFERRIEAIKDKEILEVSYVEEYLEEDTYSPFPQFRVTERPDTAVAAMLSGKIIVMVQGSGAILLCPGLFVEFFQSSEDYYERTILSTSLRFLRILAVFIALTLPGIYIALVTYHPELIPTNLLLAIIDSREGIPFPTIVEALIMMFFFELLREAGIRLPKTVGSAVSIVGALVIGEAAINAGIASPIMVVIVALTGIASFAIPQYKIAIAFRILQFPLMLVTAVLGIFGLMLFLLWINLHLTNMKVLGEPYFDPFAPLRPSGMGDVLLRARLRRPIRKPTPY